MTIADDKVTALPTLLERLGRRIDQAWHRTRTGEHEWVEGSLELMQAIAEGRGRFRSDKEFGVWLKESGHDHVSHQDRAALIGLASDLELARKVLTETTRRSYQLIWVEVKSRFTSASKPANQKRRRPQKKPGIKQAQRSVDAAPEVWEEFKTKALAEGYPSAAAKLGELISEHDTKLANERETGRRETLAVLDDVAAKNFTEKGKLRIDDAIRIHTARFDKQFEQRVNEEVRRRIDAADDAARAENKRLRQENLTMTRIVGQRGVFTERQFKQMLMLCHPDSSAGPELKAELLQLLIENKQRLVKPDK